VKKYVLLSLLAITVTACASRPEDIKASYVSPLQYQDFSCRQIGKEVARVGRKLSEVSGIQDDTASDDSVAMGVGLVLFWPALFFIDSDDQKEEVARLKGEFDALEQVAIEKDCDVANEIQRARSYEEERLRKKREEAERAKSDLN
jgi:hypothetical protein